MNRTSDDPLSNVRAGLRPAATAVTHIPASTCLTLRDSTRQHDPCRIPKTLILQNNSNATFVNNPPPPATIHWYETHKFFFYHTQHRHHSTLLMILSADHKIELLKAIANNMQALTGMICQKKRNTDPCSTLR